MKNQAVKATTKATTKTVATPKTPALKGVAKQINDAINGYDQAKGKLTDFVEGALRADNYKAIETVANYRKAKSLSNDSLRRTVSKVSKAINNPKALHGASGKQPAKVGEPKKAKGGAKPKANVEQKIEQQPVDGAKLVDLFEAQFKAMPTDAQDAIIAHLQEVRDSEAKRRIKAA